MAKVKWEVITPEDGRTRWNLMLRKRCVATVWDNGVWHTWDRDGIGGWNSSCETVGDAKLQAAGAALLQGFVPGFPEVD